MTKGTDGTWSVTTPPGVPGFHYHWFVRRSTRNESLSRATAKYELRFW
jgi:hypothetical protein